MIYIIIGISTLFIIIAYGVTINNAKYLLSGYNTMSKEERAKFDIDNYIPFFKKFHLILGISCFIIGSSLTLIVSQEAGSIFIGTYPIAAYIYFIKKSNIYYDKKHQNLNKLAQLVLIGVLILTIILIIKVF
ncbi:DUF3784 domain-containing protein [Flavivirga rizhaonensis]|uniref:DUF3784 domain-containing protein n=1 Tax=Flavivirga rizhaonensis TaxID=2559571 RepID=A0A4S1E399_9FLAO|nr:DUF3784 domain-containing protein [Flavivirga rizhaonensis]TGV04488.1 DUF3784 domain-containing protein [Flavivirga rizhaonensis]